VLVEGLFENVCTPADNPTRREGRRKHRPRDAARFEQDPSIKLDVCVDLVPWFELFEQRDNPGLDVLCEGYAFASQRIRQFEQQGRAWVSGLIYRMSKAHDELAGFDLWSNHAVDVFDVSDAVARALHGAAGRGVGGLPSASLTDRGDRNDRDCGEQRPRRLWDQGHFQLVTLNVVGSGTHDLNEATKLRHANVFDAFSPAEAGGVRGRDHCLMVEVDDVDA